MSSLTHQSRPQPPGVRAAEAVDFWPVAMATLAVTAALAYYFRVFFIQQWQFAVTFPADWGHTLAIPLIAGYFVYLKRDQLLATPFRTTWIGLIPIVLGIAWYAMCVFGPQPLLRHYFMAMGVASTLFGVVLLFFGFRAMRYLWFPLAYLMLFGQTISERLLQIVTFRLQDVTAVGAHLGLQLCGLDVSRTGNTIEIIHQGTKIPLNIAEACSGMRMLMAFLALGVAMAYTGLPYLWQRTALVLMAVPTAVFVNILRVMTLGLLSLYRPGLAGGEFHSFIGLLWLLPAFMIYLGVVWVLQRLVVVEEAPRAKASKPPAKTPGGKRP